MKTALEKVQDALLDPNEWWSPSKVAELVHQAIAEEREACATLCANANLSMSPYELAVAIRSRQ
jgi:hypothetical protein